MRLSFPTLCFAAALVLFLHNGCAKFGASQPPFDPASTGSRTLLDMVVSPDSTETRVLAATRELANRQLTQEEGIQLASALPNQTKESMRLEILRVIVAQRMTYLYPEMIRLVSDAPEVISSLAYLHSASSLMPGSALLRADLIRFLQKDPRAEIRFDAARFMIQGFPRDAEIALIAALGNETSATAATYMTEYLAGRGSQLSLPLLTDLSNDTDRLFVNDNFLGKRFSDKSVRTAAVRGVERLRSKKN